MKKVWKFRSLNLREPQGPDRPVVENLYFFTFTIKLIIKFNVCIFCPFSAIFDNAYFISKRAVIWFILMLNFNSQFWNLSSVIELNKNATRITGNLNEDLFKFKMMSLFIFLRTIRASGVRCRHNQNTHFMIRIFFFWKHCSLLHNAENYSIAGEATDDSKMWSVLVACRIIKATHTQTYIFRIYNI
jgi:hypothetical protein